MIPFHQNYTAINQPAANDIFVSFHLTKSHSCNHTLELVLGNRFFVLNWMNLNCLVPAAGNDELWICGNWDTRDCSGMRFISKNKVKFTVEYSKLSVFWNRCKVLALWWKFHWKNSVSMMRNHLVDFPSLGVPNDDTWGFFVESVAGAGHKLAIVAFADVLKLMGMTVEFVHFWPECVFDKVVVMRRDGKVDLFGFFKVNFCLFDILSFFVIFIVVIDNLFSMNTFHFGHQP